MPLRGKLWIYDQRTIGPDRELLGKLFRLFLFKNKNTLMLNAQKYATLNNEKLVDTSNKNKTRKITPAKNSRTFPCHW